MICRYLLRLLRVLRWATWPIRSVPCGSCASVWYTSDASPSDIKQHPFIVGYGAYIQTIHSQPQQSRICSLSGQSHMTSYGTDICLYGSIGIHTPAHFTGASALLSSNPMLAVFRYSVVTLGTFGDAHTSALDMVYRFHSYFTAAAVLKDRQHITCRSGCRIALILCPYPGKTCKLF